jgi:hypothetical protein
MFSSSHLRLTDGGEVVSFKCWPAILYNQEDSWYLFMLETVNPTALVQL